MKTRHRTMADWRIMPDECRKDVQDPGALRAERLRGVKDTRNVRSIRRRAQTVQLRRWLETSGGRQRMQSPTRWGREREALSRPPKGPHDQFDLA